MYLSDPQTGKNKVHYTGKKLRIAYRKKAFYLNKKRWKPGQLIIAPVDGYLTFKDKQYRGSFIITKPDKKLLLINTLPIEDYVCSVLRTESWPGWPLEVNKALAVACRTYVISMIFDAKRSKRIYHVKNTNIHQTYSGVHNSSVLRNAVDQTKGLFLAHDGKPILAMFDSCCGGVVPAHIDDFNFEKAPYLAREYACDFCKSCRSYSWQAEFDLHELENHFKKDIKELKKLRGVHLNHDKAGLVKQVNLKGYPKSLSLTGKKIYSLLKDVKSYCFKIQKKSRKIIFTGRGFGHHMGLCQWGARQMVRDGWHYRSILHFYYPGTTFMRLC